jgi:hypothetical protein
VSYFLERLQQVLFWALFAYAFAVPIALHCLLRQAFLEIGEGGETWLRRLEIFHRVYRKWLTWERLEDRSEFKTALTLVKVYRNSFLILSGNYVILIVCKRLGL